MKIIVLLLAFASAPLTWQIAIDSTAKGASLLAVAAVVVFLMGKRSAATRHLVWLVAITALLFLPVLFLILPKWRILPASRSAQQAAVAPDPAVASPRATPAVPTPAMPLNHVEMINLDSTTASTSGVAPAQSRLLAPLHSYKTVLILSWTAVATLLALRLTCSHAALMALRRRCKPLDNKRVTEAAEAACRQLQLPGTVELLIGNEQAMPMAWGIFKRNLLLPSGSDEWSDTRLRSVLLHEMGHLKRHDPLAQLLVQIACAIHWFNPLVWFAAWRLHMEREKACDDLVLQSGLSASDYAQSLLEVVAGLPKRCAGASSAVAMAQQSRLEGRLVAVMNDRVNRRSLSRRLITATIVVGSIIVIPLAMIQAQEPATESDTPSPPQDADATITNAEQDVTEPIPGQYPPGNYIRGKKADNERAHEPIWGRANNGLQLGVSIDRPQESYALGDELIVRSFIKNSSEGVRKFSLRKGVRGMPNLHGADQQSGEQITGQGIAIGGRPTFLHHLLEPGEEVEFNSTKVALTERSGDPSPDFGSISVEVSPGRRYNAWFTVDLPDGGSMHQDLGSNLIPAEDEWQGDLTSGVFEIHVARGKTPSSLAEEEAAPGERPAITDDETERRLALLDRLNRAAGQLADWNDLEIQKRIEMYENAFKAQASAKEWLGSNEKRPSRLDEFLTTSPKHYIKGNTVILENDGVIVWSHQLDSDAAGDPVMVGNDIVIVTEQSGRVLGLDFKTGQVRWIGKPAHEEAVPAIEKSKTTEQLINTWMDLVELREITATQVQRDHAEGNVSTIEVADAELAVIEAQIGLAEASGAPPKQRLALYEQQVAILERQVLLTQRHFKAGDAHTSAADVQRARSKVVEAKIKLLEERRKLEGNAK